MSVFQHERRQPQQAGDVSLPSTSSAAKVPKLNSKADTKKFNEAFVVPDPKFTLPKVKLLKSFLKKPIPDWMHEVGHAFVSSNGRFSVDINEGLLSLIAGYNNKEALKFQVSSRFDLLEEFLNIQDDNLSVPRFTPFTPRLTWNIDSIKNMSKALHCNLALANWVFSYSLNFTDILENVILPGIYSLMQAIYGAIKHFRFSALPSDTPLNLKLELANADLVPVWPEEVVNKIRQFFRVKRSRIAARARGRGRGSSFRGRSRPVKRARGYFGRRVFGFRGRYTSTRGERRSNAGVESRV